MATSSFKGISPSRPNYFPGQYLLETDFEDQHQYLVSRQRYQQQSLYVAGVVEGLVVSPVAGKKQVTVSAGTAIAPDGSLIALSEAQTVNPINLEDTKVNAQGVSTGDLYIQFGSVPDLDTKQEKDNDESFNRYIESPEIKFATETPGGAVTLARLTLTATAVNPPDFSTRKASGVRLPSPGGNLSLRHQGDWGDPGAALEMALLSGSLSVTGNIKATSATLAGSLSVKDQVFLSADKHPSSSLNGGGNIAIVSSSPQIDFIDTENNDWAIHVNSNKMYFIRQPWNYRDLVLDGTGNVGIGTDDPKQKFVLSSGKAGIGYNDTAQTAALAVNGNVGIGTTSPEGKLQIINTSQTAEGDTLILGPTNSSNLRLGYHSDYSWIQSHGGKTLLINPIGNNVGIGTTTIPTEKLEVNGNIKATNATLTGTLTVTPVLTANDNNATLSAVVINPTFNNNGKTGVKKYGLSVNNLHVTGVMTGTANDYQKAQFTMSGGGIVSWSWNASTNTGRLKWTQRFIAISMERSTTFSAGHVNITQPTTDTAIQAYDSSLRSGTSAEGILLKEWDALYAIHTVGGNENAVTFQIVRYTTTTGFQAPSNWILVAVVNKDNGTVKLGTGVILQANSSSDNLNFGSSMRQMINLYDTSYGIGIQTSTQYFRTATNFAWYKGGAHTDTELSAGTSGTVQMVIKDGNVGIGTNNPQAKLDIAGGGWATNPSNQIALGNPNNGNWCRHVIKTRHSIGTGGGNAIDFYLWDPRVDKDTNQLGTRFAMSMETDKGLTVGTKLEVAGDIIEQLFIIDVDTNPPEWNTSGSNVYKHFQNSLKGKPKGTMVKALTKGKWENHYWIGWVGADNTIYYLPIAQNSTSAGSA